MVCLLPYGSHDRRCSEKLSNSQKKAGRWTVESIYCLIWDGRGVQHLECHLVLWEKGAPAPLREKRWNPSRSSALPVATILTYPTTTNLPNSMIWFAGIWRDWAMGNRLTKEECENLRCQFGTSSTESSSRCQNGTLKGNSENSLRSQFATSSAHGGRRYLPYVFTEQGVFINNSKFITHNSPLGARGIGYG